MTLYHVPSRLRGLKSATGARGGAGASAAASGPGGKIATLMQAFFSIEHSKRSFIGSFPYLAKQPVMHALSPRHFAVHVMPRRQSPVLTHLSAAAAQAPPSVKHFVSINDVSRPPPYAAASSFSAAAGDGQRLRAAASAAAAAVLPRLLRPRLAVGLAGARRPETPSVVARTRTAHERCDGMIWCSLGRRARGRVAFFRARGP
mmetsp:Transcript_1468/g.4425  ORF Transcript_1468/g.4425 Transcript_1468/m.4425 type:complete len:203 (-) Transcript_1468:108-716(-)